MSRELSTDVIMSDSTQENNCSGFKSLKRNSSFGQSFEKRVRDEDKEMSSQPLRYNIGDSRLYKDDDEEEEYREYTEEEQMIMNISNQMINFSLNMIALDWDEYYVDRTQDSSPKAVKRNKEVEFPPKTDHVIHGYFLETLISASKRTAVYVGHKVKDATIQLVIKIGFEMGFHSLQNECNVYTKIKTSEAVPKLLDYLWWRTYREDYTSIRWGLIVLQKCGPNLVDLMKMSTIRPIESFGGAFDTIAIRMIDAIEEYHEKGFIHLSLKPEHFILESEDVNQKRPKLKLIGLSASKSYLKNSKRKTEEHVEDQKDRKLPKGDPNFHSIGYHNGFRRSRRDDMESLGYCMIHLVKGTLPWIDSSITDLTSAKVIRHIGHRMQTTPVTELCDGLSTGFYRYFDLISRYQFKEKPDYEELRKCFGQSSQ